MLLFVERFLNNSPIVRLRMEETTSMLAHYVGTYTLDARMALEEQNVGSAETARKTLVQRLMGLKYHPAVKGCLEHLSANAWDNPTSIDVFQRRYEDLVAAKK